MFVRLVTYIRHIIEGRVLRNLFTSTFTGISPISSPSVVNDVPGPVSILTSSLLNGSAPVPTSSVVNSVPDPTQNPSNLPFIVGLVVGFVGVLVLTVVMIIVVLRVVLVRQCKPATSTEQPSYDYVVPPQPHERIQLKENEAYGKFLSDTSQPQVFIPPLESDLAYAVVKTRQDLMEKSVTPEPQEYEIPLSSKHII